MKIGGEKCVGTIRLKAGEPTCVGVTAKSMLLQSAEFYGPPAYVSAAKDHRTVHGGVG